MSRTVCEHVEQQIIIIPMHENNKNVLSFCPVYHNINLSCRSVAYKLHLLL